ncbi:hypothetical protein [Pseudodesulfovibrio tunisiensis]|uniref:hypothetical protein n=1 Tax=Pseudodesulfovibrio tunisiensis TaxID=463192 RepID=UPI001FB49A1D|nr:hypothetical protein [Pseudodesulfovibrio tunisiensis]
MAILTREEKFQILRAARLAEERGDKDEADRLRRKLPLPLHLAQFMKDEFGPEYLIQGDWNLSEIEASHGKDWIAR